MLSKLLACFVLAAATTAQLSTNSTAVSSSSANSSAQSSSSAIGGGSGNATTITTSRSSSSSSSNSSSASTTSSSTYKLMQAKSDSEEFEASEGFKDAMLTAHNQVRQQYEANNVTWNAQIWKATSDYANQCRFQHSNNGGYGENLYASTNPSTTCYVDAVGAWVEEASKYNYSSPGFSSDTGHFTQVVWKATTEIACASSNCPAGSIFKDKSVFCICRYTPPGNVAGQFGQNVGRHSSAKSDPHSLDSASASNTSSVPPSSSESVTIISPNQGTTSGNGTDANGKTNATGTGSGRT
ncbi:PR-1-like protein [Pluteus cervinus]|uniref:PR-1-like protein n=1 Tax=Pluteus cervinus TaxID=181527 RepID=A0ACD3AI14_9AGAR|nr:PR-1-like protein [Pluteus cervinus]